MSGLEIAGVLLGAFPLLISSIEHWENVARFSHNFRHVKSVYKKCRRDIEYHELVYKRNLRVLLSPPIVSDADEIVSIIMIRIVINPTADAQPCPGAVDR
jgi:hypothetical protein